jgi:hypothetical protein
LGDFEDWFLRFLFPSSCLAASLHMTGHFVQNTQRKAGRLVSASHPIINGQWYCRNSMEPEKMKHVSRIIRNSLASTSPCVVNGSREADPCHDFSYSEINYVTYTQNVGQKSWREQITPEI